MLQKPGSGGSKARAAARTTTSRQKNKSPDDIVRELQRMPTNKKCADCFAKVNTHYFEKVKHSCNCSYLKQRILPSARSCAWYVQEYTVNSLIVSKE